MRWSKRNIRPRLDWFVTPVRDEVALRVLILWLTAIVVKIITGLGAVALRALIGLVHNFFFLDRFSLPYDANAHTPPSPWGAFIILSPVVGAVCVAFLVKKFSPEAKATVPEVMDAIYYNKGVIRPIVALVKSVACDFHREWRLGRTGRPHHSDWRRLWFNLGTVAASAAVAARHLDCGRHGRRDRCHFQYADWRDLVCGRDDYERGQC